MSEHLGSNKQRKWIARLIAPILKDLNPRNWCVKTEMLHHPASGDVLYHYYKCAYCGKEVLTVRADDTHAEVLNCSGGHHYCNVQMFNIRCEYANFFDQDVPATLEGVQRALAWKKEQLRIATDEKFQEQLRKDLAEVNEAEALKQYQRRTARLIEQACDAEDSIPLDELEAFADKQRENTI